MPATPMPVAAPSNGDPIAVVGREFCVPHAVDLTVTKKALSLSDSEFAVTDVNGNVVLKAKGVFFSIHERCVLVDAAGNPLLTMQQKILSVHKRWQVFRGESKDSKDLLFSVKKSRLLQCKPELDVMMAGNAKEEVCDFKIKGSYHERSCIIFLGESKSIIAQMGRKHTLRNVVLGKDTFGVTVHPHVDYAFVTSLIVLLDEINKDRLGED